MAPLTRAPCSRQGGADFSLSGMSRPLSSRPSALTADSPLKSNACCSGCTGCAFLQTADVYLRGYAPCYCLSHSLSVAAAAPECASQLICTTWRLMWQLQG